MTQETAGGLDWLKRDLLRPMPHWFHPPWSGSVTRFDPKGWAEAWRRAGVRSLFLLTKHHDGVMHYPSTYRKEKPERDYFGEQVEELRRAGIRAFPYYSIGPDNWAGDAHPEWLVRTRAGTPYDNSGWLNFSWMCLNTDYADLALGQIREIVENYGVDGIWLDIFRLPHPPGRPQDDVCFCHACASYYLEWTGGDHLLNAAGSERLLLFHAETHRRFLQRVRDLLDAQGRPIALTFNGAGKWLAPGYERCDELVDISSMECHNPVRRTTMGRFFRSMGKPFELTSGAQVTWMHSMDKPDSLLTLEAACTAVHGGTTGLGVSITSEGYFSPDKMAHLERLGRWLQEREHLFLDTEPVYDVAVAAYKAPMGLSSSADTSSSRMGYEIFPQWARVLRQGHFLFTILPDAVELDSVRLVILPGGRSVSEEEARALRGFVHRGGTLLVETPAARVHDDGPFVLEDLLGVSFAGSSNADAHYLKAVDDGLSDNLPEFDPILVHSRAARVALQGARTVAQLQHQSVEATEATAIWTQPNEPDRKPSGEPGITIHQVGRGRVAFAALRLTSQDPNDQASPWTRASVREPGADEDAPVGEAILRDPVSPWARMLTQNLLAWLLDPPAVLIDASGKVEIVLNKKNDRYILHFLNHGYGPGEYVEARGERERLGPIRVQIEQALLGDIQAVTLVPENVDLATEALNSRLSFDLPELRVHQAVEMRLA